mmetsp:Transcript_1066/g.2448  ORF Transcript_1066/g.2448 Transcript_1066/m.2448 type:complete len:239 (+) Transcript_1066:151-867(+)
MAATLDSTSLPMQSSALPTSCPRSSLRRGTTGLSLNLSSGPSLGLPRCEVRRTLAPLSRRYLMVGTAALILVSSVMLRSPSRGTLRSALTKTFFPLRSDSERSPTERLAASTTSLRPLWARPKAFLWWEVTRSALPLAKAERLAPAERDRDAEDILVAALEAPLLARAADLTEDLATAPTLWPPTKRACLWHMQVDLMLVVAFIFSLNSLFKALLFGLSNQCTGLGRYDLTHGTEPLL